MLADKEWPFTKNFKPFCVEITVPLSCPPFPQWCQAAASLQGVPKLQSQQDWAFYGKKKNLYFFPPM